MSGCFRPRQVISETLNNLMTNADVAISRPQRGPMNAFLATPDTPGAPGVVVIHEIFGLNDNIRGIAQRFAEQGYAALAVDLFSGGRRTLCLLRVMGGLMLKPLKNSGLD